MKLKYVNKTYLNWFNDEEVKKFIEFKPKNKLSVLKENIETQLKEKNVIFFAIFFKKKHIGNIKFEKLNFKQSTAYLGILIGDKKWRGKGVGFEVIDAACEHLFQEFKISKIYLGVQKRNTKALSLYLKSGFVFVKNTSSKSYLMCRNYYNNKIVLGTAQFGLNYGIANKAGKISIKDIRKIKSLSLKKGMTTLETAQAYGNSEEIIGEINFKNFNIVSKIKKINYENTSNLKRFLDLVVRSSLRKLKLKKIYAFLFHDSRDLLSKNGKSIFQAVNDLKKKGIVKNIGVAVYDIIELESLIKKFRFDIISIPFNLFDRRFENSKIIRKLKKENVKIYGRSIFLQGLLLMNFKNLPIFFKKWKKVFYKYESFIFQKKISKLDLCLNHALNSKILNKVVVGVDNFTHFEKIINTSLRIKRIFLPSFGKIDYKLINPTKWKIKWILPVLFKLD